MSNKIFVKRLVVSALFSVIAYLVTFVFRFNVTFLTFDLKDAIIAILSFLFGPVYGVLSALVVALLELFSVSDTGLYGFIMNFLSSGTFAFVCGIIYKYKHTIFGAVLSLALGSVSVVVVMLIANIFITPFYMGVNTREVIALIPTLLLPFNLAKTIINASATMVIYKPITNILRRMRVIEGNSQMSVSFKSVIVTVVSVLLIVAMSLFVILYLNGVFELFRY